MARLVTVAIFAFLLLSTAWAKPQRANNKNPRAHPFGRANVNAILKQLAHSNVGGTITCDGCQLVVAWAENELAKNATEAQIENYLNNTLCQDIPSVVRAECENIVEAYFPELVSLLLSRENPTTACTQIKLCP